MRYRGGFSSYRPSIFRSLFRRLYRPVIIIILTALIIHGCLLRTYTITSSAMEPDLHSGDVVLIQLFPFDATEGTIVLAYPPYAHPHNIIGRIFALLPWYTQTVQTSPLIRIISEVDAENVMLAATGGDIYPDSDKFGPIEQSALEGKVIFRIWPPGRFGSLSGP